MKKIRKIIFFLLGERIANPIINVCYGLIACMWRFIWLKNNGPKKLLEIYSLKEFKDKDHHIFFGYYDGAIRFVDGESSGIEVFSLEELKKEIEENPHKFTEDIKFMIVKYEKFIKPIK